MFTGELCFLLFFFVLLCDNVGMCFKSGYPFSRFKTKTCDRQAFFAFPDILWRHVTQSGLCRFVAACFWLSFEPVSRIHNPFPSSRRRTEIFMDSYHQLHPAQDLSNPPGGKEVSFIALEVYMTYACEVSVYIYCIHILI